MAEIKDRENAIIMETSKGRVVVELFPDLAPGHVKRIKELTREGAYDGVVFHRVIDGFMAQTGDVEFGNSNAKSYNPGRAGMGGSDKPDLKAEFNNMNHGRGTCSMARAQNPNSANSQFFICFADASFLNRQYTVWGQVIEGMENVDKIKRGEPVKDPDKIVSMKVAADLAA
jgi:cyclophilin family peptidyl-prolyl cis-trans isomerase